MTEDSDSSSDGSSQHKTTIAAAGNSDNNASDRIYDVNNNNSSGSAARNPLRSHFLYADYTPLEDDRNLIEMLKAFVSLTAQVIRRRETDARCVSLLDDSELLRKELSSAIRNTRASTTGALDRFYERNSGIFASVAGLQSASGNAFLTDAKTSLDRMLVDVEASSTQQQEKHKENIRSIINANRIAAIDAMQVWLSDERCNFPRPVLGNLSSELAAHIDPAANNDSYKVIRTASAAVTTTATIASSKKEVGKGAGEQKDKVSEKAAASPSSSSRFTYISQFNTAGIEFWNYRKKVIDFGIEELTLPTGMKLPMSEKVKSTFRLSSRKEEESAKEPHFAKVDDFYVSSVVLRGEKTLEVLLASDVTATTVAGATGGEGEGGGRGELFTVVFDAARLLRDSSASVAAAHPIIRYMDNKEQAVMAETNLLQIKEIEQATNLRKLAMFGAAILSKLQILRDPNLLALKSKLELLTVEEKDAIVVPRRRSILGTTGNARGEGRTAGRPGATNVATPTTSSLVFVEFPLLFNLIEALARSFGPVVERLREKTPVREELILRQELDRGQRKEFAVRLEDLRSQLGETPFGRSVFRAVFGS